MQSALSNQIRLSDAIDDVCQQLGNDIQRDAAVVFVTHDHAEQWDSLATQLRDRLDVAQLIGCSAEGVVGLEQELEEGPGLSVLALSWPGTQIVPIQFEFVRTAEGGAITGWPDELMDDWPDDSVLLLFADPFSFPADYLLHTLNEDHPGTVVVGGMASGASEPGENRLLTGRQAIDSGAVAWLIHGASSIQTVVSQGCRPIGDKYVVTAAEQNMITSLGGQPALRQLQRVYSELPNHEQALMQRGLHLGRVVSEYQDRHEIGDFLIRNVMGVDQDSQAIVVGDFVRPGQTVQFHLRDERSAELELVQQLDKFQSDRPPSAALLFTCNGRGTRLFAEPHHDAQQIARRFGKLPLAGLFAQGEIGPVGGRNFVHGFTASIMVIS